MKACGGFALVLAIMVAHPAHATTPHWTVEDARALSGVIDRIDRDGLDPADYDQAALQHAMAGGESATIDAVALRIFRKLASDLWQGHVRGGSRVGWHIQGPVSDDDALDELTTYALAGHRVAAALDELTPRNPDYLALKALLAKTPVRESVDHLRLRVNMERWRWLPRDPGSRYLLVNVPTFTVELSDAGRIIASHRIIVGKLRSPTPQFATMVTGVILNPWWEVPPSIVAESVGSLIRANPAKAKSLGYVTASNGAGGLRIRQAPGRFNALGKMKLVMPNPFTVYLHDTPAKALFEKASRAFSHGCMRVDQPIDLAEMLLATSPGWSRKRIDSVLASGVSTKIDLADPIPVYVVYFTMRLHQKGNVTVVPDIYGRDAAVAAALTDKQGDGPGE